MSSYRISHLPELPASINSIRFRKALSAMSVHAVSRRWLRMQLGLSTSEINALLLALRQAGVLQGPWPDAPGMRSKRPGLWARLLRWLRPPRPQASPARRLHGWLDGLPPQTLGALADDLQALLSRHPHARGVLTHLSLLEHALRQPSRAAARTLSHGVLSKALEQLGAVMTPSANTPLALLRTRLMLAVHGTTGSRPAPPTLEVSEVGLSRFVDAQQRWDDATNKAR